MADEKILTIDELLTNYRNSAASEVEKGAKFERLMKNFLLTYPVYDGIIEKVWLWNDFPFRADFGEHDLGIDLVAKTFEGELWAVQCKFYAEDTTIEKAAVDSFISSSARVVSGKKFSKRIFISTSGNFTDNARKMLENQTPPVIQMDMSTLRNAAVDWEKLDAGNFGKVAVIQRDLRKYQRKAIAAAHDYFKTNSRGKLIMACGTGKTFTSLKIAEDLTEGRGFILFLVPSLSLMGQTLNEWASYAEKPFNTLLVCSDETVTKKAVEEDTVERVNLPISPTSDPQKIFNELKNFRTDRMTVIFSTYQSIEKVIAAQKIFSKKFDLVICDEAHRTAGYGDKEKVFSLVHDDENINAEKRMYMTATPKLFSTESQKKAKDKDNNLEVWSMDNEKIFGGLIYSISFRQAINNKCLSPYKVLVLTISQEFLPPALKKLVLQKGSAISTDDALRIAGCINALSKRTRKFSKKLTDDDPGFMHKAVAFCQSIKASQKYEDKYKEIQEKFFEDMTPEQRKNFVNIEITHIDGTNFKSEDREKILHTLATNTDENLCKIVSNVRCLSEGVDVPSLDAVIFLSPKRSHIEIVQAVGRALRVAKNKNFGYIIIPVIIPMDKDPDTALNNSEFKEIWSVLNAIRSHDENFDIYVQQIKMLLESDPPKLPPPADDNPIIIDGAAPDIQLTLDFNFDDWAYRIYTRMVDSVGDRHYWYHWAQKISDIVKSHTDHIKKMISQKDSPQAAAFNNFLDDLHNIINPAITADEAVDMLAQHLVTRPVFEALFDNFSFVQNNPVSKSMTQILYQLDKTGLENDRAALQDFYNNVKESCKNMGDAKNRQKIIVSLYDSFFKIALPQTVERLGIVYTPVEVVDFILNSVNDVLQKEFHRTISAENVHVLDPFSGTGTFITRLIESGLIQPADLLRKYQSELHANEIVLLAYYISAINIENAFHAAANLDAYQTFSGVCLTDTFQTYENAKKPEAYLTGFENSLRENSALIKKQLDTKIEIIVGNPPYSVGQKSANDNNQNIHYKKLEQRIQDTYAAKTDATNKNSLYDSYIKAFRWASDRISAGGVVGFITNSGWIDKDAFSGFRKSLQQEFSSIYVFNLKGAIRGKIGDIAKREGQNIFDIMTGVAITILVKNPDAQNTAADIFYLEVEDYLSRDAKLKKISAVKSVLSDEFKILTPNDKGDWINQRGNIFENYLPLAPEKKFDATPLSFFVTCTNGLQTNRDAWVYNFSKSKLAENIQTMIDFYNQQREEFKTAQKLNMDSKKISWSSSLESYARNDKKISFEFEKIIEAIYRPFCKTNVFYNQYMNHRCYQLPKIFPTGKEENLLICVSGGSGGRMEPTFFIVNKIIDLNALHSGTQCFPMYWYEEPREANLFSVGQKEYTRRDGVTDYILEYARALHGFEVSKEDIFYYVYGFLHLPRYREEFAADLKKSLPRLVMVQDTEKFFALSNAGRQLAEIHLNYETQEPPSGVEVIGAESKNFAVTKLRLSKDKTELYYNKDITIKNIPARAFEYVVNGRSPLEWIIDRYQVKTDKASQITNNPNDWCKEHNDAEYILKLILSCITVSLKTLDIVENLPEVDFGQ